MGSGIVIALNCSRSLQSTELYSKRVLGSRIQLVMVNYILSLPRDYEQSCMKFVIILYFACSHLADISIYNNQGHHDNQKNVGFIRMALFSYCWRELIIYYMSKLKQKHIEQFLQDMQDFEFGEKDKIGLQQHMTPPDLAAKLLYYIYQNEPIENMVVADLGVGTGMLICGLVFIGSAYSLGVELDQKYVYVARDQLQVKVEGGAFDIINANVAQLRLRPKTVDLVVMNPPFGTKQEGIDMKFMEFAMGICSGSIYSMHKSSTRAFIAKFCQQRGYLMEVIMEVNFPLKKRFNKYHKKEVAFTQVDVIKVTPFKKKQ